MKVIIRVSRLARTVLMIDKLQLSISLVLYSPSPNDTLIVSLAAVLI